ncbi:hypothetical protein LCGC14_2914270, partial [marine sediment metagenome]
ITNSIKGGMTFGNSMRGVAANAGIDAGRHFVDSVSSSAINAVELTKSGRVKYNTEGFVAGIGMGALSSVGRFGGSFVNGAYDVRNGATWSRGGYNYNDMYDGSWGEGGRYLEDYFNVDMKRAGGMLGGFTEQAINNMTGVSNGFTFNVLNSRDFGLGSEVGMLSVTLGGRNGFGWDVSTGGINASVSNMVGMSRGVERLEMYKDVMRGSDAGRKAVYLGENTARYSFDSLTEEEKAAYGGDYERLFEHLDSYLRGDGVLGIDFSTEENRREGDRIYLDNKLLEGGNFAEKGGLIEWDMNKVAKLTSLLSHEVSHDGVVMTDDYDREYAEDIAAHAFDTVVWEGMKNKFGVEDHEMDRKLIAYRMLDRELFENYLESEYVLGKG